MVRRFLIKLKAVHDRTGLTAYAVGKRTGMNHNTVRKYVERDVIAEKIQTAVVQLAEFYGVDWRDPEIVEVIEVASEDDAAPESETPLLFA